MHFLHFATNSCKYTQNDEPEYRDFMLLEKADVSEEHTVSIFRIAVAVAPEDGSGVFL